MNLKGGFKAGTDFRKSMGAAAKAARIGATKGMQITIDGGSGLKQTLRSQIRAAGLGDKVANALRSAVYPKGAQTSLQPAGTVFSRAPHIMRSFTDGAVIRPVNGSRFLWIPTKNCPRASRRRFLKPEEAERRFGKPRFAKVANGDRLALYPQVGAKAGGFRKSNRGKARDGHKAVYVGFFILVPSARIPKKLDPQSALAKAGAQLNGNIAAAWPNDISRLE